MYNRYIPQSDGTYRKNRMPDTSKKTPPRENQTPPPPPPPQPAPPPPANPLQGGPIGSFLRQLLPRDFDTADLMIVLLLLLMAGDNEQERGTALLTLALYFIM